MKNYDINQHVTGTSVFLDDLNPPEGTLHASVFASPVAHGIIKNISLDEALKVPGVIEIITSKDIPGENQIGGIVPDEVLLAEDKVDFIGQPIAVVIAEDVITARKAVKKISIDIEPLPVITDAREACKKGELIVPPKTFTLGNIEDAWKECDIIVEGTVESGGQEHLYLETQGALAYPAEGGVFKIISSTQSPTAVQRVSARILSLPMHKVEVDVMRLGGGFGGKEDQASAWAAMAALASYKLNKPVKLIPTRQEDMRITGKRNPYSSDYKIGLKSSGEIIAYEATYYQNAGAAADLSPAILDRTLFHCTNSYFVPNVKATAYSCRTNLPPNTAFRGFGGPQGMFVIEAAIDKAATKLNIDASKIQEINLLKEGDEFPFGQKTEFCQAESTWHRLKEKYKPEALRKRIQIFNSENKLHKKGMAFMPICFGISFTNTFMNQASALVHVYTDGSISVSTAAVEMGQGVNEKIRQVAASVFSIDPNRIKIETTNTTRIANTSPTAASSAADLNGKATENACTNLLHRLKEVAKEKLKTNDVDKIEIKNEQVFVDEKESGLYWNELIQTANLNRISLSSHAHFATPNLSFNKETNKGNPFAYHVYGAALVEATVDCLRGTYKIDSVQVVHDFGKSLNPAIDKGQTEGGLIQGIGWMTIEEVMYNDDGKLLSDALSTYKVPDIYFTPKNVEIEFLENADNPFGVFKSKAIGEPPFMYSIGAYFAILNAMKAFRPGKEFKISAPITNEKVLMGLYEDHTENVFTSKEKSLKAAK